MNKEEKDELFSDLSGHLEKRDVVLTLDGPLLVTVKLKDNTYRRKTVGQEDFWLSSIYAGQKDMIFVFEFEELSEDNAEYACIEIPSKEMDTAFPFFLEQMQMWMRDRFMSRDASRLQEINKADSVRALVNMAINFETDDNKKDEAEVEDSLATLPTFGMF